MILPIYLYGNPVLRKTATEIDLNDPTLKTFISDMYETMYHAEGVGLATTASVVLSIILIFISDYFLTVLLYVDK